MAEETFVGRKRFRDSSYAFTKLFTSITESTVWGESMPTRIVWICMLAMADQHGRVMASVPGLAHRARVSLEEGLAALERFMTPDPYSRTPDHEGRRIEVIDGGWRLLNYAKYRALKDEEAQKERHAKNQAAYRERQKDDVTESERVTGNVTESERVTGNVTESDRVTGHVTESDPIAEAEAEAEEKILVGDFTPDVDPGASKSKVDPITPLVKDGWDYWLERTERHESQNKLTRDRLAMGRKGFESLIAFAKERKAPQPVDAAVQLFQAAVDRMASSPFHSGQNEQGTPYNNWQHLFAGKGYPSPRKLLEFWLDDARWDKCS
jgi:hypothetical protein